MTMINQDNITSEFQHLKEFDGFQPYGDQRLIPTFKGWHAVLQRQVIVRLLPSSVEEIDSIQRRTLKTLMHQVIHLYHPGMIKWFKFEEISLQNNRYFCLINEWFSNESLKDWLVLYGSLNEENVVLTAEHAITVLQYYWNQCRLAHGNLNPENILVDKEGNLKIDKFGFTSLLMLIAWKGQEGSIGTPAGMAPELRSASAKPNNLSDIYALGMTLACLLTGLQIAQREQQQSESHVQANMPDHVPMSLEMGEIISHMTAARPEDRFPSWEAVHAAIKRYEQSHEISMDPKKKTQTIRIPVYKKNPVGISGAAKNPVSSLGFKGFKNAGVAGTSTKIKPVVKIKTPKLKEPIPDPTKNEQGGP